MPRLDPAQFEALDLRGADLVSGYTLHDVWGVDLTGGTSCSIRELRALMTSERFETLHPLARALFRLRSILGRVFRLDSPADRRHSSAVVDALPTALAADSQVPPGTPEGPFTTLYVLPTEAAYHVRNATVEALVLVALAPVEAGQHLYWAVYLAPVGRVTALYMALIDPFRRLVVYPGLERWLVQLWSSR